jgi:hypothetical protein
MKRIRCVFILFVSGTMLVLGGCSQMPRHYGQIENYPASRGYRLVDDPVPNKELCTLLIEEGLILHSIGRSGAIQGPFMAGFSLRIAAGERTLVFDYETSSNSYSGTTTTVTTFRAKDIGVTYTFEPGRTYRVYPSIDNGKKSVSVAIDETSLPVQMGFRMGPYLGWQRGMKAPFAGVFVLAQAGVMVTADDLSMEFIAEGNAGVGYSPFMKESPAYVENSKLDDFESSTDVSAQTGGTANFYFGKSQKKAGFGLGGGVSWMKLDNYNADNAEDNVDTVPYVRASFLLAGAGDPRTHIRLFVDYSFTREVIWKRFGFGMFFSVG